MGCLFVLLFFVAVTGITNWILGIKSALVLDAALVVGMIITIRRVK